MQSYYLQLIIANNSKSYVSLVNYEDLVTSMTQLKILHLKDDDKFSTGPYVRVTDNVSDSQLPYQATHYSKLNRTKSR